MTQKKQNYFKTVGLLVFRPIKPANRHNVTACYAPCTAFYAPCTYFVNIYCTVLYIIILYILYIFCIYSFYMKYYCIHICFLITLRKKTKKKRGH